MLYMLGDGSFIAWMKSHWSVNEGYYLAEQGYSHCVEPGRSDRHFFTAGCVKQSLTRPSEKAERGVGHIS